MDKVTQIFSRKDKNNEVTYYGNVRFNQLNKKTKIEMLQEENKSLILNNNYLVDRVLKLEKFIISEKGELPSQEKLGYPKIIYEE